MFKFEYPIALYFFILIPVILIFFFITQYRKKKLVNQFGNSELIGQLMPFLSTNRPIIKLIFFIIAFTFFVIGLAGPEFGSKMEKSKHKGVEIIIALDVSNSMMAQDIQPCRLERAKQAISQLVDQLKEDKIGLIVFAGEAYTQLPITTDYVSAKMFLSTISTKSVAVQGTAIGDAINLAARSFTPDGTNNKAIILITDGENHEDDAVEASKLRLPKGEYIFMLLELDYLMGLPIPVDPNGNQQDFMKDENGNVVISKLDEKLLQEIATTGNGVYIRSTNSQLGLSNVFKEINKMNKTLFEAKVYTEYSNQFQWAFGISLLFLFFELIILERKSKWSEKIKLFENKNPKV